MGEMLDRLRGPEDHFRAILLTDNLGGIIVVTRRPMWVVLHAAFYAGNQLLGKKDYHVFCKSPTPGGGGSERWFVYSNPGFSGVTAVSISTNKEDPWTNPGDGWEFSISGSTDLP